MKSFCELQIVIPVYEDWESVSRLLPMVDEQLMDTNISADIMLVDDCSQQPQPITWKGPWKGIRSIRVLRLKRNLGHQRAICIALCHLNQQTEWKRVLIMDGDGEDSPTDIPKLNA
ncbi:MAG: glycosyltransferase [Planctomycetota bacterium]|nr:glycosyltransferase [Planctomycetota bacterium]